MATEDLVINDSSNGETVETISERLPQLDAVPPLAWMEGGGGEREDVTNRIVRLHVHIPRWSTTQSATIHEYGAT